MLWSDEVLKENSHAMKRLWLSGTIAASLCSYGDTGEHIARDAVEMADLLLAELNKGSRWEKTK